MTDSRSTIMMFDCSDASLLESPEMHMFIKQHKDADPAGLRLRLHGKEMPFDSEIAITQIECRRKASGKLPSFVSHEDFMFPSLTAAEQSTDEEVARYHAEIAQPFESVTDLTAGLGIDALSMALAGKQVTAIEIDSWKCEVLRHNAGKLLVERKRKLEVICNDSCTLTKDGSLSECDLIFIDPARRGEADKRLYGLKDSFPDVTSLMPLLLEKAPVVMVKASPLLDITEAIRELPQIREIHIISRRSECKEVLLICGMRDADQPHSPIAVHAIDLLRDGKRSVYTTRIPNASPPRSNTTTPTSLLSELPVYLYEPNASMMKILYLTDITSDMPGLVKADPNTSLYISTELYPEFPGRITEITELPGNREIKAMKGTRLTIISRNYPEEANAIRKRIGAKEGDEKRLYACRVDGKPILLLGHKIV